MRHRPCCLPSHDVCVAACSRRAGGAARSRSPTPISSPPRRPTRRATAPSSRRSRRSCQSRARALRRLLAAAGSDIEDASPQAIRGVPRPLSQHAARRPPARRMAEVPRPPRDLVALRRRLRAARQPTTSSSPATTSCSSGSATATARWPMRCRCGSPASATPDACEPAFAALSRKRHDHRRPTGARASASRARPATCGSRKRSAATFPARTASPTANSPTSTAIRCARSTKGSFAWTTGGGRDLALFALERAARSDAGAARAAWVKWRDRLPEADRRYGNAPPRLPRGAPAASVRQRLVPRSGRRRRVAGRAGVARARRAARARVERRHRRDRRHARAQQQDESAWRYWRARALIAKGKRDEGARDPRVARQRDELLRHARRRGAWARATSCPSAIPLEPAPGGARGVRATRADVQARASSSSSSTCGPSRCASGRTSCAACPTTSLLLAADHARRVGLYDRAINTADRTQARHDYALRYLAPYRNEFEAAAKAHDVDIAMLYGIARQESRFIPDIVSSAGAVGLMQLMPGTARWVAKQLARTDYQPAQIGDTELNTQFGAFYFKYWLERLDGMPALAAAAYNAGPGRAQAWRPAAPLEGAIWVETIPFNETRDYVKKVLANAMIYARRSATRRRTSRCTAQLGDRGRRAAAPRCVERRPADAHREVAANGAAAHRRPGRQRVRRPPRRRAARRRPAIASSCPTRRREQAKHLILLPTVDVVEEDIHDPQDARAAVRRRVPRSSTWSASSTSRARPRSTRVHVELARKVIAACRAAGVPRLLHMSALGAERATARRAICEQGRGRGDGRGVRAVAGRSSGRR